MNDLVPKAIKIVADKYPAVRSSLTADILRMIDQTEHTTLDDFYLQVQEMILQRQEQGLFVPEEMKRRDRREPMRTEKEILEDNINMTLKRYWKGQRGKVLERVNAMFPDRKNFVPFDDIFDQFGDLFNKAVAALVRYILTGVIGGVELFAESVTVGVDWAGYDQRALDFAKTYAFNLIKDIDATSKIRVSKAVQSFVELPGFTIGDLEGLLKPIFGEQRSRMIAVTETTRAYARGQQLAADELKKKFPDVRVVKTWFTNNDDQVCELCGPLNGVEVDHDKPFYEITDEYTDGNPPRHVNCRCWISSRTRFVDG